MALDRGSYHHVGIEDLWATALKEGRTLFVTAHLWGATSAAQTGDMLGQTTIGPWQITTANAREYGGIYGIKNEWNDRQVASYLEARPFVQARIAADFIEGSYSEYGRRSPFGIQRYFWLEGFQQKKIGQGVWYASVLAKNPASMPQTGFYAKQLLLGSRFNPEGLLYWLYRSGDEGAVRDTLTLWKSRGFEIAAEDLDHCSCNQEFRDWLLRTLAQIHNPKSEIRNPRLKGGTGKGPIPPLGMRGLKGLSYVAFLRSFSSCRSLSISR